MKRTWYDGVREHHSLCLTPEGKMSVTYRGWGKGLYFSVYSWNGPVALDLLTFEPLWDALAHYDLFIAMIFKGDLSLFYFEHIGGTCSLCVTGQMHQRLTFRVMWLSKYDIPVYIIYNFYILYSQKEFHIKN